MVLIRNFNEQIKLQQIYSFPIKTGCLLVLKQLTMLFIVFGYFCKNSLVPHSLNPMSHQRGGKKTVRILLSLFHLHSCYQAFDKYYWTQHEDNFTSAFQKKDEIYHFELQAESTILKSMNPYGNGKYESRSACTTGYLVLNFRQSVNLKSKYQMKCLTDKQLKQTLALLG